MMLRYLVDLLEKATGLPVKPFGTDTITSCLVYEYDTGLDNGVVCTDQLNIRIIAFSIGEVLEIERKVKRALLSKGDSNNRIKKAELNGGGLLEDKASNTFHKFGFYNITYKSEV